MRAKMESLLAVCLMIGTSAFAQFTYHTWTGTADGDWTNALNWANGTPSGSNATAQVYEKSPNVPNDAELYTGRVADLDRVWVGQSSDTNRSGRLVVRTGATLRTDRQMVLNNGSELVSSGEIEVGDAAGLQMLDTSTATFSAGSVLNKLVLKEAAEAVFESGSAVTTISPLEGSARLTLDTTYSGALQAFNDSTLVLDGVLNGNANALTTAEIILNGEMTGALTMQNDSELSLNGVLNGNLNVNNDSSATISGLLNGNLFLQSTLLATIESTGRVEGNVSVSGGDQLKVAGMISNGVFNVNQTGSVTLESTASVYSDGADSWLYNDAEVTWNVGADGSVCTLWTTYHGSGAGIYDGEWRYDGSTNLTVVLDAYDYAVLGNGITLRLMSGVESEGTFTNNVTFMFNGDDVSADFVYQGAGAFHGEVGEPVEVAPVAIDDAYSVAREGSLVVSSGSGVLANDVYSGALTLSAMLVDSASDGVLSLNGDGSFSYSPNEGFSGADDFTYKAYTSAGTSDVATVSILVEEPTINLLMESDLPGDGVTNISVVTVASTNEVATPLSSSPTVGVKAGEVWGGAGLVIGGEDVLFTVTEMISYSGTVYSAASESPLTALSNDGIGIRSAEGGTWFHIDGLEGFAWSADKALVFQGLGLRNGWAGDPGIKALSISSDEWIGLSDVNPGTGIGYDAGSGAFTVTNVSGNAATDDNFISAEDLVGASGPALSLEAGSSFSIANLFYGVEGFSPAYISFSAATSGAQPPAPELESGVTAEGFVVSWMGADGATYAYQMNTNLVSGAWSNVLTGLSGEIISVTNDTSLPAAFYQVIVE